MGSSITDVPVCKQRSAICAFCGLAWPRHERKRGKCGAADLRCRIRSGRLISSCPVHGRSSRISGKTFTACLPFFTNKKCRLLNRCEDLASLDFKRTRSSSRRRNWRFFSDEARSDLRSLDDGPTPTQETLTQLKLGLRSTTHPTRLIVPWPPQCTR